MFNLNELIAALVGEPPDWLKLNHISLEWSFNLSEYLLLISMISLRQFGTFRESEPLRSCPPDFSDGSLFFISIKNLNELVVLRILYKNLLSIMSSRLSLDSEQYPFVSASELACNILSHGQL